MYIYRIASEIFKAFHLNSFSRDLNISFLFSLLFESGKERVKIKKRKVKKKKKEIKKHLRTIFTERLHFSVLILRYFVVVI